MDTSEEFKAETGEVLEEGDMASLNIVDDDEPIDPDAEVLPEDAVIDPLAPVLDDKDDEEEEVDEDRAELDAYMYQDFADRE